MPDDPGLMLVRWTVRLAVACYAVRALADAADLGSLRLRRGVWTVGLLFYVAHVVAAFHFVHRWSHVAAWEETARQTAAVTGWDSGAGLWANYAFTLLWFGDVVAWWAAGPDYPLRFRRAFVTVQTVFAFIVFNATAVFGPAYWRPAAVAFGLTLAAALAVRVKRRSGGNG
ncbi:MAG TPA: hypothetical protein VF170_15210 [Planctomycetaceae bacterium]